MHESKRFMSKQPESEAFRRIPVALPADLNSLRFLGGGEQKYLLVTELFALNEDETSNTLALNIRKEDTHVRVFFEDSTLSLKVKFDGEKTFGHYSAGNVLDFMAPIGKHKVQFEHLNPTQAKNRRKFINDRVMATIMVAESDFLED